MFASYLLRLGDPIALKREPPMALAQRPRPCGHRQKKTKIPIALEIRNYVVNLHDSDENKTTCAS